MQLTIDIGYDQLFELVRQLPAWERERLVSEMATTKQSAFQAESESRQDLIVVEQGEGYRILQVPFPDTEEGRKRENEQKRMQDEVRQRHSEVFGRPKCSREEWRQILSSVPTLNSEDAQGLEESMNNFRKEFNNAFERRSLGFVGTD